MPTLSKDSLLLIKHTYKLWNVLLFVGILASYGVRGQSKTETIEEIDSLRKLAASHFMADVDSSLHYSLKVLEIVRRKDVIERKASIYLTLSNTYHRKGDLPKAMEYIDLAEIVAHEVGDASTVSAIKFQKGSLLSRIGSHDLAVDYINQAGEEFLERGDTNAWAKALNALSGVYASADNLDKAISLIHEAMVINEKQGNRYALAANHGNLSLYYMDQKKHEQARAQMRITLKEFQDLGSEFEVAQSFMALAGMFSEEGHLDSAEYYMDKAAEIIFAGNDPRGKMEYYKIIGGIKLQKEQYDSAFMVFEKAYTFAHQVGFRETERTLLQGLYESSKYLGHHEAALEYYEKFKKLSDSLNSISGEQALFALELNKKFEHQKDILDAEKKEIEAENRNAELREEKKNYIILSLILAGVLLIFIAFMLVRSKQKAIKRSRLERKSLSDELDLRNKELVSSALQVLRKNEEMKKTIESLQSLRQTVGQEEEKTLEDIIRKLKFELEHSSWEEFEVPFKKLHSNFYNELIKKFPDLTRAEIKVCSLLKLDLDTKQIASILHKSPASIEVDRSRIRKKMNLTNKKTSLSRFINTNF